MIMTWLLPFVDGQGSRPIRWIPTTNQIVQEKIKRTIILAFLSEKKANEWGVDYLIVKWPLGVLFNVI